MKLYTFVLVFLLLMIIIPDIFFYRKLRNNNTKPIFIMLHLLFPVFFSIFFIYIKVEMAHMHKFRVVLWVMWLYFFFLLIYIPKLLHIITYFINYLFKKKSGRDLRFLNPVRIILSSFIVIFMLVSAYITPRNYEVTNVEIPVAGLPAAFNNFKIVQLSDIHLGSWNRDPQQFDPIVKLVNAQEADMIVFTGDMVNNFATETYGWDSAFHQLHARYAKFAVLGNHDYGDYTHWKSEFDKSENKRRIMLAIERFGFRLLLNENAVVHKDSDSLIVAGVENWGKSETYRYSKLDKAIEGIADSIRFILLSHDPNQWDAEIVGKNNIALTLSGHTHAAQSGIRIAGKLFSPASFVFKRWSGLYQEGDQYLYVNRGVGYIGLPMMMGVRPEITVITLKSMK